MTIPTRTTAPTADPNTAAQPVRAVLYVRINYRWAAQTG